jgi:GTP-binding protein EngB required for normal cell division
MTIERRSAGLAQVPAHDERRSAGLAQVPAHDEAIDEARRVDPDNLVDRTEALTKFVLSTEGILPAERLAAAYGVASRAGDRLRLSGAHTVVALAGATGSGKSSIFNALAGMELSRVGVRRPTTAEAYACVWGELGAKPLLDWLGIGAERRFTRESALDAEDQAGLRGLVLLDLPDFDSRAVEHRVEADRLLALVDLVVWVTDPQKYADQVIHERYLQAFRQHREVAVVVLNQADRLGSVDADRCVADLRKLLAADGLAEVPVFPVSATSPQPGIGQLRQTLEYAVKTRAAALYRLAADLDEVSGQLADLAGPEAGPDLVSTDRVALLADGLGAAAGVPAIIDAAGAAYRRRAIRARWTLRGPRRDQVDEVLDAEPAAGQDGAISLAIRDFTEPLTAGLPVPWADAITAAARSRQPELTDALRTVVADTELDRGTPTWARLVGLVRWLAFLVMLAGLGWLAVPLLHHQPLTPAGRPAALAIGGAALWLVLTIIAMAATPVGARNARARTDEHLRRATLGLAREYVAAPARDVVIRYAQAREALQAVQR